MFGFVSQDAEVDRTGQGHLGLKLLAGGAALALGGSALRNQAGEAALKRIARKTPVIELPQVPATFSEADDYFEGLKALKKASADRMNESRKDLELALRTFGGEALTGVGGLTALGGAATLAHQGIGAIKDKISGLQNNVST